MLRGNERYVYNPPGLTMLIDVNLEGDFTADLLGIWQSGRTTVIHMLYNAGSRKEDHAWFIIEANPSAYNKY